MVKSNIKKEFNCDIEKLWNIITENTNYGWRSELSKIELKSAESFEILFRRNKKGFKSIYRPMEKLKNYN